MVLTILKSWKIWKSMGRIIIAYIYIYEMENKTWLKPPTSIYCSYPFISIHWGLNPYMCTNHGHEPFFLGCTIQASQRCGISHRWSSPRNVIGIIRSGARKETVATTGYLVGGIPTPLKNMKVSWDDETPNIWKNNKCSKPPTSYSIRPPIVLYPLSNLHWNGFRNLQVLMTHTLTSVICFQT